MWNVWIPCFGKVWFAVKWWSLSSLDAEGQRSELEALEAFRVAFDIFLVGVPRSVLVFPWFSHGFSMVFPWFFHGFSRVVPSSAVASSRLSRSAKAGRNSPWRRRKPAGNSRVSIGEVPWNTRKAMHKYAKNMCFFNCQGFTNHRIVGSKILRSPKMIMETIDPIIDFLSMFESAKISCNMKQGNAHRGFRIEKNVAALPALNCLS